MTLQQLKYIVAIDEYGHFGKAAEACGLTQSTLSLMLKKLEEELDVRIFDRDAHPVTATEIGRKIIEKAKVALYYVNQIPELTRSEKELLSGTVRVAFISTVSTLIVPSMFKYFGQHFPAISLQTEEMITETVIDKLRKTEVDMGIVAGPVNQPDLLEIPLYHERFLVYIHPEHPLAAKDEIQDSDLYAEPIWMMRNGLRKQDLHAMEKEGVVTYERFFEGGRVGMLIQIVNENGGLTIIPETHRNLVLASLRDRLRPIVNPSRIRTISLVVRNDYIHEGILNAVVDAVKSIIPRELWDPVICHEHLTL
jgi:LysR family hydrogen peroxide-inducible transcriptional activator